MKKPPNLELKPGVWADSRRALFLQEHRLLCVADLHLGFDWAHRATGQMLPVRNDDTAARLQDLCRFYSPERLVVLGDIVHRAVPTPQIQEELTTFLRQISACARVVLVAGNHDRGLEKLLPPKVPLHTEFNAGNYTLVHGDAPISSGPETTIIMGHEHPAISLGDGVRGAKFPGYLVGPRLIVMPAFSTWAAGSDVRRGVFLTETAKQAQLNSVVAIMGDKLLRIPLAAIWKYGGEREIRTPGGV